MARTRKEDIVTIDGPSGVGKSTVAKAVAEALGFRYLDTGAMYRAATLAAIRSHMHMTPPDEREVVQLLDRLHLSLDDEGNVLLDGERIDDEIRQDQVTCQVSVISALRSVRAHMVKQQQIFGREGRIVAEGRDLGTVVFPEAAYKFYLDADSSERARRRARQNRTSIDGASKSESEVLEDQRRRDRLDSERSISPLSISEDMIVLDTTHLDAEEVVEKILTRIRSSDP